MQKIILDIELFEQITDDSGRERHALKSIVPKYVLRSMGLVIGEMDGREEEMEITQLPVKAMDGVSDRCIYTADFGRVENNLHFTSPVQLVTIPCRSPTGDDRCTRTGQEQSCPLFGVPSSVETPGKEKVEFFVVPVFPGTGLSTTQYDLLVQKREGYQRSLRQWEDIFVPINIFVDASSRGMQFWIRSWFGGG